jgi:hypothetical protein
VPLHEDMFQFRLWTALADESKWTKRSAFQLPSKNGRSRDFYNF